MLDFNKLRGGPDGWRGSFERLICQLGEINPPVDAIEYRPIDGSGGDGGVEAYWVLRDGREIGYQAKFHRRVGDIDWSALDNSIKTALSNHPKLFRIIVAMPCDLTDVKNGRGKSAREKWNDRVAIWRGWAGPRDISFDFQGETQIERLLASPSAAGLSEYWFAETTLSDLWFREQFANTVAALDERYHPEDHVDVQTSDLFAALRGSNKWRQKYVDLVAKIAASTSLTPASETDVSKGYIALNAAISALSFLAAKLLQKADSNFPKEAWVAGVGAAESALRDINTALRSANLSAYELNRIRSTIDEIETLCFELSGRLKSAYQTADETRYAIIEGEAGSGKSHLMASEVATALDAGEAAIMLLGTDFSGHEDPGVQIARRLGLVDYSSEVLLGALEAAAAARGTRALIAIDALNEGGGARYWRNRLAAFAERVRRYPRLTLCVACRDVFSPRVFTPAARSHAAEVTVSGFEGDELERAAAMYMDNRGIARPASPWLAPEFANPLFLRTTCVALERQGKREFPLGLRGARQMLRFYLDAAATTLDTEYDGSPELERPLIEGVLAIAAEMARRRVDYIEQETASRLLNEAFKRHQAPPTRTWLDLLKLRGLLREDPAEHDDGETHDPLMVQENVLRFAFQRIQDQLIAKSLIQGATGPTALFAAGGPLSFIISAYGPNYEWRGVFDAIAIEFADEWKSEIVDHLPDGWEHWWQYQAIQASFIESVRWRQHTSFTDRTRELLNRLDWPQSALNLLIELSAVDGHPWNADMLHRNLVHRRMPERDAFWTIRVNRDAQTAEAAYRLATWALGEGPASASDTVIRLALKTLGWLFTSTNPAIRDKATKGATEILLRRSAAIRDFLTTFTDVDDVYVLERVLAAIAGACLRDPTPARLTEASAAIWDNVFSKRPVPKHVLLRDYARLVMELANDKGVLPDGCDVARCRPPYDSRAPIFGLDEAKVEAECKAAGDHSIFHSTAGWGGDFGDYIVKHRVQAFTSVRLTKPQPLRYEQAYENFKRSHTDGDEFRTTLVEILELVSQRISDNKGSIAPRDKDLVEDAETALFRQLGSRGKKQYRDYAQPFFAGNDGWVGFENGKLPLIDQAQARLWIARQAIRLGWTDSLFPKDPSGTDESGKKIERIGKKYQWIAYHDLTARLADNFWLASEWGDEPARRFDTPVDLSYVRDIEPTLSPDTDTKSLDLDVSIPTIPRLQIAEVATADMYAWTFDDNAPKERLGLAFCEDILGAKDEWLTLYRYESRHTEHGPGEGMSGAPYRLNDFHFILLVGMREKDAKHFAQKARNVSTDFHEWMQWGQLTDGPYLYEAGIRSTWPDAKWITSDKFRSVEQEYLRFCRGYHWEHHLDATLPRGCSMEVPTPWLMNELQLTADPRVPGVFRNGGGVATIVSKNKDGASFCVARRDALEAVMINHGVVPVWVGIGERGAWPDPTINAGPNRRWNGVLLGESGGAEYDIWADDHRPEELRRVSRHFISNRIIAG